MRSRLDAPSRKRRPRRTEHVARSAAKRSAGASLSREKRGVPALAGLKVLDLTRLLPGAFCSLMLADHGAEVIKIEQPGIGDYNRGFPPINVKEFGLVPAAQSQQAKSHAQPQGARGKEDIP